jgi:hypothetical protein
MKVGNMSVVTKKVFEQLTEGLHNVTITKVEDIGPQETNFGTKDMLRVTFTSSDQKDKEGKFVDVRPRYNKSLHAKSAFVKALLAPLGFTAGAAFDTDELVGTKCQVVIQHKENDGTTYANVTAVLKVRPAGKPATQEPVTAESF